MKKLFLSTFLIAIFSAAQAGNFTVSSVAQFQTALNTCASNGQNDTINVLAGTYNVNPALTFSSNENYFLLIRGVGSPVLDGGNARRILLLTTTAASGDIYIDGLTIQHGLADYGGGLNIGTQAADISVNNCSINDNTAGYVSGGANLFSNTGSITVTNSSFRRNSSPNTSGYPYGNAGGLFIQTDGAGTTIKVTGCTFELNTAQRDAAGTMLYPLGNNSTVIAESNTFLNNTAKEAGAGCWIRGPAANTTVRYRSNILTGNSSSTGGNGGGTYIQITSGSIDLCDNIYTGNNASWQGGGLWIEHSGGSMNIYRNRFINNSAGEAGGGAHVFLASGTGKVDHNIFNKNRTLGPGGGINFSTNTGIINIFNNTFFLNTSADGGDVNMYFENASAVTNFVNNILYKSSQPALSYSGQQTVIARYCDIQGGAGQPWFGTGCVDKYPFFVDTAGGNFHLQDSIHCGNSRFSPCIDAGSPSIPDSLINCNWGLNLIRSDMGAYGGKYSATIGIKTINSSIPEIYNLYQNYPNPFNPVTKIKFDIPDNLFPLIQVEDSPWRGEQRGLFVTLKVYDALGREIQTLVREKLNPGSYEIVFNGEHYPSGVYFYCLVAERYVESRKMILLK